MPAADVELIRRLATELRTAGEPAERLRASFRFAVGSQPAQTGDELIDLFRNSPLVGEDLSFERDRSPGPRGRPGFEDLTSALLNPWD